MSEANVKTNETVSKKWRNHKERVFPVLLIFFENFSLQEPIRKRWSDVTTTEMFIFILFASAGISFEGNFSL